MRTADVAAAPWKNGGGVTRELLALRPGGDWRVRISVADVARDG
ncbi:MAG TPA: HutD family protein, partial [Caldimonas sp.]|nr:HutD family protein [Caldimonas sp.]